MGVHIVTYRIFVKSSIDSCIYDIETTGLGTSWLFFFNEKILYLKCKINF